MKTLAEQDLNDKQFAYRLAQMIESGLIHYKYYMPWTNEIIMAMGNRPYWILELTTERFSTRAAQIAREFASSEPFEAFDNKLFFDEYLACLYLRYGRGEISWATFLRLGAEHSDGDGYFGSRQCEHYYSDWNELEAGEFSKEIEAKQRAVYESEFSEAIARIEPLYQGFLAYFKAKSAK